MGIRIEICCNRDGPRCKNGDGPSGMAESYRASVVRVSELLKGEAEKAGWVEHFGSFVCPNCLKEG